MANAQVTLESLIADAEAARAKAMAEKGGASVGESTLLSHDRLRAVRRLTFYQRISFLGFLRAVSAASRNRVTLRSPFRAAAMILLIMTS